MWDEPDDILRSLRWTAVFLKAAIYLADNKLEVPIAVLEEIAGQDVQLYFDKKGDKAVAMLIRPNQMTH